MSISFLNYLEQLSKFVVASSVVLGLIVGIVLMIVGKTTIEVDLTFDFSRFDGLWFIVGLPVVSVLVFAVLSPLSFLIFRYGLDRDT